MKNAIREISIDAKLLYERISKMKVGEIINYKVLSEIIGRDVQGSARSALATARRMAERQDKKTYGAVINEGIKCLTDVEIVRSGTNALQHIKRHSRKSLARFNCIGNLDKLSNEEKIKLNTSASLLGVISYIGKSNNIKKIAAAVQKTNQQLPYVKTLNEFK